MLAGSPTFDRLLAIAREETERELEAYERLTKRLARKPIKPGWIYKNGRWILRGEYEDIPRRFLDTRPPSGPPRSLSDCRLGDEDDKAAELGFADGDALREHLRTLQRPTIGKALERLLAGTLAKPTDRLYHDGMMNGAERQRKVLEDRAAKGWCRRCPSYLARPAMPGRTLCEDHSAAEVARVATWRAKKKLAAGD